MAFCLREIQVAGVGPISGSLKLELQPGFNPVYVPVGRGKSSVAAAIAAVLGSSENADLTHLRNRNPETELFRVGAVLEEEGNVLRVMRDLTTQSVAGSYTSSETGKISLRDEESLLDTLIGRMEFCLPDDWRTLFFWQPETTSSGTSPAADGGVLSDDPDELRRDLQELQEERMLLGSTQNVQGQVDDLQRDVIELEKKQEDLLRLVGQYDKIYQYLESHRSLQEAGEGLMERARNFNAMQKKYEEQQYRHEEKSELFNNERQALLQRKVWLKDFRFPLSIVLFVGSIVAAGITTKPLLSLPGLVGLGFGGYLIWQYIVHATNMSAVDDKIKEEGRSFAKRTAKHEEAVGNLLKLQGEYKLLSPEDLVKLWDELNRQRKELVGWQDDNDLDALRTECESVDKDLQAKRQKYEQLNAALGEAAGNANDLKTLDRKIRAVQKRLQQIEAGDNLDTGTPQRAMKGVRETLVHGEVLTEAAARAGRQGDSATMFARLARRLVKLLPHFFAGAWQEAFWQEGQWLLRPGDGGKDVGAELLSAGEQRLFSGLVRIALWQDLPPNRRFPIVMDEPFGQVDDDAGRLLFKLFNRMGQSGQVILFTGRRVMAPNDKALSFATS